MNKNSSFEIKEIEGKNHIFDKIRKKYVVLTPEEKVRQWFIDFLIENKYSKNLMKTESALKYDRLNKRSDLLVFDRNGLPYLLVEFKAEQIKINQEVLEQASRYNSTIKAPYLCITNGVNTFCFEINHQNGTSFQIKNIPDAP